MPAQVNGRPPPAQPQPPAQVNGRPPGAQVQPDYNGWGMLQEGNPSPYPPAEGLNPHYGAYAFQGHPAYGQYPAPQGVPPTWDVPPGQGGPSDRASGRYSSSSSKNDNDISAEAAGTDFEDQGTAAQPADSAQEQTSPQAGQNTAPTPKKSALSFVDPKKEWDYLNSRRRTLRAEKSPKTKKARNDVGKKDYEVEVTGAGKIDGGCAGHVVWVQELKGLCVQWAPLHNPKQRLLENSREVIGIYVRLSVLFDYFPREITHGYLAKRINQMCSDLRSQLKPKWEKDGRPVSTDKTRSVSVNGYALPVEEWKRLVKYWQSQEGQDKSAAGAAACQLQTNKSGFGKGGTAGVKHRMKFQSGEEPSESEKAKAIAGARAAALKKPRPVQGVWAVVEKVEELVEKQKETDSKIDSMAEMMKSIHAMLAKFPTQGSTSGAALPKCHHQFPDEVVAGDLNAQGLHSRNSENHVRLKTG